MALSSAGVLEAKGERMEEKPTQKGMAASGVANWNIHAVMMEVQINTFILKSVFWLPSKDVQSLSPGNDGPDYYILDNFRADIYKEFIAALLYLQNIGNHPNIHQQ